MLTDLKCKNAKGKSKPYKLFDSGGLYLQVNPSGNKNWRLKYRFHGKEKTCSFGAYPNLPLVEARDKAQSAKALLREGIDPSEVKQSEKRLAKYNHSQTFEVIAREWHTANFDAWSPNHAKNILYRLETQVFPEIGDIPISKLTPPDVLACAKKIEVRSKEMARRAIQMCGQVLRYAVGSGRADRDFTSDLRGLLKKYDRSHYASIEIDELPDFLKVLNRNDARLYHQTINSIKLLMLTFVRTSELIKAEWEEIDLEKAEWKIPAKRMKMRLPHFVPLSKQAVQILIKQRELASGSNFVFPSIAGRKKTMSNNTILKALKRMKYEGRMTGHGFRSLAMSTLKEKLGYRHEVIDRQLAHQPKNKIDKAYDRAKFIPERIRMMQDWADYIDTIFKTPSKNDRL